MARPRTSKADKIRSMLEKRRSIKAIAKTVGTSAAYVYRLKRQAA